MKKLFAFTAAIFLCALSTTLAGKQDFTLVNKTGVEIHNVYVSPHSADDWEEDVLGKDDTLENGASVEITFDRASKDKNWDLKVTDKEGHSIVWEKINLLEVSKVTLHYKNSKATADLE